MAPSGCRWGRLGDGGAWRVRRLAGWRCDSPRVLVAGVEWASGGFWDRHRLRKRGHGVHRGIPRHCLSVRHSNRWIGAQDERRHPEFVRSIQHPLHPDRLGRERNMRPRPAVGCGSHDLPYDAWIYIDISAWLLRLNSNPVDAVRRDNDPFSTPSVSPHPHCVGSDATGGHTPHSLRPCAPTASEEFRHLGPTRSAGDSPRRRRTKR